jgi:hypothetical protein
MRNDAPLLLVLTLAILASARLAAETPMLYGKTADWEMAAPAPSQTPAILAESMETPNQRRHRLGLAIEPSFPAQDIGIAEETPNHRRQRLSLAAEENRLASAH